jgi:hypothetical protein
VRSQPRRLARRLLMLLMLKVAIFIREPVPTSTDYTIPACICREGQTWLPPTARKNADV